ncbi:MAG: YdcF family protein [Opitutaceae bacterium]|nr:YdcF family protein [Opitutaceae bacterium]
MATPPASPPASAARALPDAWLVVCGPRIAGQREGARAPSHARVLADAAVELGFPRERIVEVDTPRDTAEEVAALALLAGADRVALVTSAWHLPRAMRLAEGAGLNALPCPADYLGGRDAAVQPIAYATWDAESLAYTTRAWREYLGMAWARLVAWWHG